MSENPVKKVKTDGFTPAMGIRKIVALNLMTDECTPTQKIAILSTVYYGKSFLDNRILLQMLEENDFKDLNSLLAYYPIEMITELLIKIIQKEGLDFVIENFANVTDENIKNKISEILQKIIRIVK
jgi:hypothetical protein